MIIDKSKRTVERYLKSLQEREYIRREGPDKNGYWKSNKSISLYWENEELSLDLYQSCMVADNKGIHYTLPFPPKREKNVGIYCQVSTNSTEQLKRLSVQVSSLMVTPLADQISLLCSYLRSLVHNYEGAVIEKTNCGYDVK